MHGLLECNIDTKREFSHKRIFPNAFLQHIGFQSFGQVVPSIEIFSTEEYFHFIKIDALRPRFGQRVRKCDIL